MAPTASERYLTTAYDAGCPADQMRLFRLAEYVATPRQLQFHAACRLCDAPDGPVWIGYGGARGPGKSHALLAQMAADDCQRRDGLKCLLLRKVGKSVRESVEDLRLRVLRFVPHEYNRSDSVLKFANGSRIILGHFKDERDVDAYLGLEYDVIGVEEATTLGLAKWRTITTCSRTSRSDWRPRIYLNTNPGGVGHAWFKQTFIEPWRRKEETSTRFVPATVDDNPFVNAEYRKTLDSLTGWQLRAWRSGDWDIAAGQFFTTWSYDRHTCDPFPIPAGWRCWLAMDWGFQHYCVVYLMAQDGDGHVYIVAEHAKRQWLVPRHAEAVRAMLERHDVAPKRAGVFVAGSDVFAKRGDSDRGTLADQWRAEGFVLKAANNDRINGAAEYMRRLGDPDAGIAPRLSVFRTCTRLIECLPTLEHDPHNPEDVLKVDVDEDGNGGDDPYDASRYGLMVPATTRHGNPPQATVTVRRG